MSLWLLIILVFVLQEFATTAAVLALAVQSHLPFWPIHIIYILATIADMYVGFFIAKFTHDRFKGSRFIAFVNRLAQRVKGFLGKYGDTATLTVLAAFDYPYMNTFIAAWLGFSKKTAFALTFLGNFAWYVALWATVLGIRALVSNPLIIALILIVAAVTSRILFSVAER